MKKLKSKKVLLLLLALVLTLTVFTGCGNKNAKVKLDDNVEKVEEYKDSIYPMDVEDQFGNTLTFEKKPESIVSLAPSHTEILFSLGLGDKIVGDRKSVV